MDGSCSAFLWSEMVRSMDRWSIDRRIRGCADVGFGNSIPWVII